MRRRLHQFVPLALLVALVCFAAPCAFAQRGVGQGKGKQAPPPQQQQRQATPQPPPKADRSGARPFEPRREGRGQNIPPDWENRLRQMSPEEQDRWFNNNRRFPSLSPERQRELRERLHVWNSLNADQRRAILERERVWRDMSPQQRQRIRQEIFPRWQQLPQDRKQGLLRRLRVLRDLPEDQRRARLADPRFIEGLSDNERELLDELSRLRIGPGAPDAPPL